MIVSAGRLDVVMVTVALTTIDRAFVADAPTLSATFAVKLEVPDAVGVPVIAPDEAVRDSPAGRDPEEIDHVRGDVPPLAARVWLYEVPTVPFGRLAVVMPGAVLTVIDSAFVAEAPTLSATFAVKLDAPEAVGVPVIAPLEATIDRPAGRLPEDIDHVSGDVPPVTASV